MATKVKAKLSFVGSPKEVEEFGGQLTEEFKKREDKVSDGERASFQGKINAGTELTVSDRRAKELEKLGLVEIVGESDGSDEEEAKTEPKGVNIKQPEPKPAEKVLVKDQPEKKSVSPTAKAKK